MVRFFFPFSPWLWTCLDLLPELSMPMSFSSPPVTHCWALEELLAVADPLGSSGPRLLANLGWKSLSSAASIVRQS